MGTFVINNILYDVPSGIVRLTDPRGSFGEQQAGIYGDRKYDIAKLAHSAIGGYDFVVNNKYTVTKGKHSYDYSFGNKKSEIAGKSLEQIIADNNYRHSDIKFIMSTLFLSMCPLHKDSSKKQLTFFIHGLKLLNEVYSDINK